MGDLSALEKYLRKHHLFFTDTDTASLSSLSSASNSKGQQGTTAGSSDKSSSSSSSSSFLPYAPQRLQVQLGQGQQGDDGQLQQWLEMTLNGLGRHDHDVDVANDVVNGDGHVDGEDIGHNNGGGGVNGDVPSSHVMPLLRLTDALMSLNYLIATGMYVCC